MDESDLNYWVNVFQKRVGEVDDVQALKVMLLRVYREGVRDARSAMTSATAKQEGDIGVLLQRIHEEVVGLTITRNE